MWTLRLLAVLLGSGLMIFETIRSWGQGRNLIFVLDDFWVGIPLVVTAVLMGRPTVVRHCAFCAAFAASSMMMYGSFFSKLSMPAGAMSSNLDERLLTALAGLGFAASVVGLVGSLVAAGRMKTAAP